MAARLNSCSANTMHLLQPATVAGCVVPVVSGLAILFAMPPGVAFSLACAVIQNKPLHNTQVKMFFISFADIAFQ
jgi:hypothetical protein